MRAVKSCAIKIAVMAAVLSSSAPASVFAKGSSLRFRANVVSVEQTSETGATVKVRLHSFEVPILVNADTEIESHGDEVGLGGLSAGAFVKIAGFFSEDGIVAEEIDVLDALEQQFRLRGIITHSGAISGGFLITLLGVDVLAHEATRISPRGPGEGVGVEDLESGMVADVTGFADDGQLVATRIHIGGRASEAIMVEFEGTLAALEGSVIGVDTEAAGTAVVLITEDTRIHGELEVGRFVEVKGMLDETLAVVARSIKVDRDGDGDADDDIPETEDAGGPRRIRRSIELTATSGFQLEGEAATEFVDRPTGGAAQTFLVVFHHGAQNAAYTVRTTFASGTVVDFGPVRANGGGRVHARFRTHGGGDHMDLSGLLPGGETVTDITRVEILNAGGEVVSMGTF